KCRHSTNCDARPRFSALSGPLRSNLDQENCMRKIMAAAAVAASLALASTANAAEEITLRIGNYGGLFTELTQKCTGDLFTSRTGIKVRYLDGNPSDHLAKLLANQGREQPYDLVYLDDGPYAQGLEVGLYEKLDPAIVTNLKH